MMYNNFKAVFHIFFLHVLEIQNTIPYNGNNPRKKMFANWRSFLIHEKTFVNGANPSRIYSFSGTYIAPCHTHFSNEGCHCRSPTKQRQCSSYSGHTHLQLLNRVILTKHSNTAVEYSVRAYNCSLKTSLRWNAYRSQAGFSAITTLYV